MGGADHGFVTIDSDLKIIDWDKIGVIYLGPISHLIVKGSTNITSKESKTSEDVIKMDSSFAEFVGGITVQNSNLNELASLNKTHLKTSKFDVINNKTFNSTLFISIGESEFEIANENNTYADINIEGLEVFTSSQLHDLPYFELFYIDDKGVIKARNINVKEVIVKDDTVHHDFCVFYGQYEPSVIANNIPGFKNETQHP